MLFVALLTLCYLSFELAFNARLLDVVGGGASQDDVHQIEISGRLLSGCAVALVVLQQLLMRRKSWLKIVLACAITIAVVYVSLQSFVNYVVDHSTLEFRRQALNVTLIQKAVVDRRVQLEGVDEDPGLFSRPEGKAFLAMFSFMAASVDKLDQKIAHAKLQLLASHVGKQAGGIQGYYDNYRTAIQEVTKKWQDYQKVGNVHIDVEAETNKRHNTAWNQYLGDLGKRGWTPSTVPVQYHDQVRRKVRKNGAPVSNQWALNDEAGFRAAIAQQVRRKSNGAKPEVKVRGQRIPFGLSLPAFIAHPALQAELREKLRLPSSVSVPHNIDKAGFQKIFDAMRLDQAAKEARKYTAPLETFAPGGSNFQLGEDATRAALVPPIALFFSMLGAMGHLGKLVFVISKITLLAFTRAPAQAADMPAPARRDGLLPKFRLLMLIPVVLVAMLWQVLGNMDNAVTQSSLYQSLTKDSLARWQAAEESSTWNVLRAHAIVNAVHVVSVGQSYAYPYNEALRVHVLRGISFGYQPETH